MDALLTQRHVAQTIVDKGGEYVMIKDNQPRLRADIELVFTLRPSATGKTLADRGYWSWAHRQRNITTSEALVGYSDWPGLAQVFEVGALLIQKTGEERVEVVYGVTSLSPARATPGRLLALCEGSGRLRTSRIGSAM